MHNSGYYTASICEVVRWLGERAEEAGVNIFAGFPVDALLVDGESVRGVRTTPSGLSRDGSPGSGYTEPTEVTASYTNWVEYDCAGETIHFDTEYPPPAVVWCHADDGGQWGPGILTYRDGAFELQSGCDDVCVMYVAEVGTVE